jgi:hypothetical protein
MSHSRLLAGIGLEDLLVVATDDVIVVAHRGESQHVKDLVTELKRQSRNEATENTTVYRPWGSYTVMGPCPRTGVCTVKLKRDAFKAYDIRGRAPEELNEEMFYRIGRIFCEVLSAQKMVVGRDIRLSSLGQSQMFCIF